MLQYSADAEQEAKQEPRDTALVLDPFRHGYRVEGEELCNLLISRVSFSVDP